jgi:hypothetical protein
MKKQTGDKYRVCQELKSRSKEYGEGKIKTPLILVCTDQENLVSFSYFGSDLPRLISMLESVEILLLQLLKAVQASNGFEKKVFICEGEFSSGVIVREDELGNDCRGRVA